MRTTGFELETNIGHSFDGNDTDRAVRNGIGRDWVETGVRRVSLRSRLRFRIALWLWKPVRRKDFVLPSDSAETEQSGVSEQTNRPAA